ncbi:calponin homology domain-containing protein DDB_G0272472 [Cyclospora cayetanensis]|uniref:Trichohyalin-plectin-homology domain-containing protein n=2 Tax=Cyclospora cayetanensis TaxID=88456 RepID=A0A1D3D3R8_9EIME|nr:calponin homology domain-containing protein DDB_G0272472 [Cyclospora cayetanensis]OEH78087.1 hypothetical protein cyc_01871 [Cyclospora cayetanensis]
MSGRFFWDNPNCFGKRLAVPGVTLYERDLQCIQKLASGALTALDPGTKELLLYRTVNQKGTVTKALSWRNSPCGTKQNNLIVRPHQQEPRSPEPFRHDVEGPEEKELLEDVSAERDKDLPQRKDEKFRVFIRALMIADTVAGQKEQQRWAQEKRATEKLRQSYFDSKEERKMQPLAAEELDGNVVQAGVMLKHQIEERAKQRMRACEETSAALEAMRKQLQDSEQAEIEGNNAKKEKIRSLHRDLMLENEALRLRRKAAHAQKQADEAAALACAAKIQQREEMIRKRRDEIRACALDRSERLTAHGAAALTAAQIQESLRQERQQAQWEANVNDAEEKKQKNRQFRVRQLIASREGQLEEKRREEERRKRDDLEYAEFLRAAAVAADAKEEQQRQEQRRRCWQVRLEQERQAKEREQLKKQERERMVADEQKAVAYIDEEDRTFQRFAEDIIEAAKEAGAEWRILEVTKQRLLSRSSISRPRRTTEDEDE